MFTQQEKLFSDKKLIGVAVTDKKNKQQQHQKTQDNFELYSVKLQKNQAQQSCFSTEASVCSLSTSFWTIYLTWLSKTEIVFEMCFQLQLQPFNSFEKLYFVISCLSWSLLEVMPLSDNWLDSVFVCVYVCVLSLNTQQGSPCLPLLVCVSVSFSCSRLIQIKLSFMFLAHSPSETHIHSVICTRTITHTQTNTWKTHAVFSSCQHRLQQHFYLLNVWKYNYFPAWTCVCVHMCVCVFVQ